MLEYWELENWDASTEYAVKAAQLYRGLDQSLLYANAVLLRGYAHIETASRFEPATQESVFQQGLTIFDEALRVHESIGNRFGQAHVLNFIGYTRWSRANRALDDFSVARDFYNRSAALFSSLGEWREELNVLQNIVVLDQAEGKSLQAIRSYERILERLPSGRDAGLRAAILGNLGAAHFAFGNIDDALRSHSSAYEIYASIGDTTGQGYALKSVGQTYFAFGDAGSARSYLDRASALAEQVNDFRTQAEIEAALGNLAFASSDYPTALERHRSAVNLSASSDERARRALLVARDLAALGRHQEAIETARTLQTETRSVVVQSDALLRVALSEIALGRTRPAFEALDIAAKTYESLQLTARQGDLLHAYSLAARAEGNITVALEYGRAALDKIETLRERVAHPELRALSSVTRRTYYEDQIDLLMSLHAQSGQDDSAFLREALTVTERSRARLTIDLLGEAAVDLNRGMDSELAARRRTLYATLAEKRQQQERVTSKELAEQVSAEMNEVENELTLLETEYRRARPASSFASQHTLEAAGIQARVDSQSVLLQYALGETRSFVWVVTSESIRGFVLPRRAVVEDAAKAAHLDLGRAPGTRQNPRLDVVLQNLSKLVLHDVSKLVAAKPRLLVAADGALQYIPFGVLPVPSASGAQVLLVADRDDREIIAVASMSAREAAGHSSVEVASSTSLAVFADPVMEDTDSRFHAPPAETLSRPVDIDVTTRSFSGPALSRLPFTGQEAQAIAELLPNAPNLIAVGFDASLDAVLGGDLRQYRYVHFATHGIVDSEHPALSALALSQYDEHRQRRAGFLRLYDIYTLELDAEVVVLSACETGLGREIRGEGLIGLTQGFMYAGARNVVASLWQVPDRATAELMTRFYRLLLSEQHSPASALAAAQRSLAQDQRADPYYWGAFVIQGS
jgi:CHAT domain-containing protein